MPYTLALNTPTTTEPTPATNLLSQPELEALNARISANADKWLADNAPKTKSRIERKPKSNRGAKPKVIENPFYGFIGCTTYWGRYPAFAMDIIEGIARLDWHDRPTGIGGKSMPLSVRNLVVILESVPAITNEAVEDLLQLGERHARRYVKAIELIVPWMMKSRPQSLINEMDGIEPEPKACEWDDCDDAWAPSAEELAKLHHDLRTLTVYKTAEEYEAEYPIHPINANVVTLPTHNQHQRQNPKRQDVMRMLAQGMAVKAIERDTGVSAKTIRKWRDELQNVHDKLQVA
ncbi:helix-turn-helix domain-containing protein [Pseudomonas juntendi]|uniref:helix-turn-helix domain-containing protein n=1 Tax=Pseudomonas juntendi TaxID=2666183 RepID=UPI0034D5BD96